LGEIAAVVGDERVVELVVRLEALLKHFPCVVWSLGEWLARHVVLASDFRRVERHVVRSVAPWVDPSVFYPLEDDAVRDLKLDDEVDRVSRAVERRA